MLISTYISEMTFSSSPFSFNGDCEMNEMVEKIKDVKVNKVYAYTLEKYI